MKKNTSTIIAAISCFLVVVCLFQISGLKQQIRYLDNNINNRFSNIDSFANNIYANVENQLNEQAKLMTSSDWTLGEVDIGTKMATMHVAVAPKEYRPDTTTAILICNDTEYPMSLKNGEYIASLSLPLFERSVLGKVLLVDNGVVQTESLNWDITPRFDFLPELEARFVGNTQSSSKNGATTWKLNGEVQIHLYQKENGVSVQSISMLEYIDGKEMSKTNIPLNTTPSSRYGGTPERAVSAVYVSDSYPDSANPSDFYYLLDKSFDVPNVSELKLYIEMVDSYGLHYRIPLDYNHAGRGTGASIYDENGKLLWGVYSNLT